MSQKSSVPQAFSFVSQVLKRDTNLLTAIGIGSTSGRSHRLIPRGPTCKRQHTESRELVEC